MPLIRVEASVNPDENRKQTVLLKLSEKVSEITGKPETYIMASFTSAKMIFAKQEGSAAYIDLKSIGVLGSEVNRRLSEAVCKVLNEELDIPPDRIYINFDNVERSDWGWNSGTF